MTESKTKDWKIFQGNREPHNLIAELPPPPKWRKFNYLDNSTPKEEGEQKAEIKKYSQELQNLFQNNTRDKQRGQNFRIQTGKHNDVVDAVNAALYLRRPLLVTGKPGSGKTSLAYAVAYELGLGSVLLWAITSRSTLQEGLYRYDAIARLQDVQLADTNHNPQPSSPKNNIGDYIQLGAIGTAFLPSKFPRVLLIDEIDKSDINLPNDLLNLFEEGEFEIPELARLSKQLNNQSVMVRTKDNIDAPIKNGRVRCSTFPFVIMTSNGEREFPPAFLRRCLRVNMPQPDEKGLTDIVKSQLDVEISQQSEELIKYFANQVREGNDLAIDQLLNIIYLVTCKVSPNEDNLEKLKELVLKRLTSAED